MRIVSAKIPNIILKENLDFSRLSLQKLSSIGISIILYPFAAAFARISMSNAKPEVCKELQGLSLRNVAIQLYICDKVVYKDFGEMLFTHFGVSGPIVLSASSYLVKTKNIEEILKNNQVKIEVDLKPALSEEKLDARILRDFEEQKNKQLKNSLDKLLPQKLIPVIIEKININENKKINEITKQERQKLVNELKHFKININGTRPIEEAIVTSGGINVKEINPKTMEAKRIQGLYFAGEVLDVDALTGGFNLQIAWSTGYVAGMSAAEND